MKTLTAALAILVAAGMAGNAEPVYSDVVGYQNLTIKGSASGSYFNFIPVQLSKAPVFVGTGLASGLVVTLAGSPLGDLISAPHYLIIKSGSGVGLISDIVTATSTTVTTTEDLSSYITTGTSVAVIPHVLLSDVLGSASNLVIQGGTADTADLVYLVGSDGSFTPYYFKNVGFGQGWKNASTAATVDKVPVYPSEAILVERKSATDTSAITQIGFLASTEMKHVYAEGLTSGASAFPASLNLASLTSVVQGGPAGIADTVYLVDQATGQLTPYYYKNAGLGQGWKDAVTAATVDAATINIGSGFIIQRNQSTPAMLVETRPY